MTDSATWAQWGFNIMLGIASFFGATWLRRMEGDMKDMQRAHAEQVEKAAQRELTLQEKLNEKVGKEDFREFRSEMLTNFQGVFNRMDTLADRLPKKTGGSS